MRYSECKPDIDPVAAAYEALPLRQVFYDQHLTHFASRQYSYIGLKQVKLVNKRIICYYN